MKWKVLIAALNLDLLVLHQIYFFTFVLFFFASWCKVLLYNQSHLSLFSFWMQWPIKGLYINITNHTCLCSASECNDQSKGLYINITNHTCLCSASECNDQSKAFILITTEIAAVFFSACLHWLYCSCTFYLIIYVYSLWFIYSVVFLHFVIVYMYAPFDQH